MSSATLLKNPYTIYITY